MKAIIPVAGRGTRLRPHTHLTPKPLVRVAGRPIISYILDDLVGLGVNEVVFVVGYLGEALEAYVADSYPEIRGQYVVQATQNGTAGAVDLAEPLVEEDVLIVFGDTIFDADLTPAVRAPKDCGGIIWANEVVDYQNYGVILTNDNDYVVRMVEKPLEPISRLANSGICYVRDWKLLFEGIRETLAADPGPAGEYYLTDALQYLVDRAVKIQVVPAESWHDCGGPHALLDANRHLLENGRASVSTTATVEDSTLDANVRLEEGAVIRRSTVHANVTVESGALVEDSTLEDTMVGAGAVIQGSDLSQSLVGARSTVHGMRGRLNLMDCSEVRGGEQG